MLDWMKGVMGRGKGSPLQKLLEGAFKDEGEKQALLAELATDDGLKVDAILPLITHKDASISQRGATMFLTRADADAVGTLFSAAAQAEGEARASLVKVLAKTKVDGILAAVDRALKDTQADKVRSTWGLVLDLPPELSDSFLERGLESGPPPVRVQSIERLVKKFSGEQLRARLVASSQDREHRVRRIAVGALEKLAGNDVFEAMLDRLSLDDNPEIRGIAAGYLQRFITNAPAEMRPQILGRLMLTGDPELQATLLKALFASGNVGELLLEILTFCKTILGVQHTTVMNALKQLGDPVLDATIPLLAHADADIRVQALLLLEKFAAPRTVAATVKLVSDPDWWVRIMAVETLGRLKDPRVLPAIEKVLPDTDCRFAAIDALGNIGGDSAFANLLGLIRDDQPEVRLAAVSALARVKDSRVSRYLEEVAKIDKSLDVRIRAVELVRELKGGADGEMSTALSSEKIKAPMDKLLAYARESGASDLHISPGEPPVLRVNGTLTRVQAKPMPKEQVEALLNETLDSVRKPVLEAVGAVDFCYSLAGVGRYRANIFRQQRGLSGAFRCIPNVAPTLAGLGLPKHLDEINAYHQGIVLLTGPAGSGKSTTLTALVNVVNENRQAHVLTLEDPIEFLHPLKKALINQREIGRDSKSFASAMRAALREDPDVVVVGELRDRETIRLALLAAETGHLVIGTMQTTGAVSTIDKLVESFPTDEQQQVRVSLSGSLKLIVSQQLVPKADRSGRIAVFEILKTTSPIRTIIREGKTFQLPSAMQIGRQFGMLTIDASLEEMLEKGLITLDVALAYAEKKDTFLKAKPGGRPGARAPQPSGAGDDGPPSSRVDPPASGAAAGKAPASSAGGARPQARLAPGTMPPPGTAAAKAGAAAPGAAGARATSAPAPMHTGQAQPSAARPAQAQPGTARPAQAQPSATKPGSTGSAKGGRG